MLIIFVSKNNNYSQPNINYSQPNINEIIDISDLNGNSCGRELTYSPKILNELYDYDNVTLYNVYDEELYNSKTSINICKNITEADLIKYGK